MPFSSDASPVTRAPTQLPGFVVDRPRLLDLVAQGTRGCLTLVVGPSGAGKTVLLRQWRDRRPAGTTAWLTVDVDIADAPSFARQLVGSIAEHRPGFGAEALRHLEAGGTRMGAPFLEALAVELGRIEPIVVVIDDLHELPPPLVAELGEVVERAPERFHLVVGSRTEPAMRLARLRAHGQLTEIRASALAFRDGEAAQLVEHVVGRPLTPAQLRLLRDRTEGWAVGVQLAALALRQRADVDEYLRSFSGANRAVADYLADEVVRHLPPALRSFLWSTSVLDRVNAELGDELTGRRDGHEMLAELERRELFVVALDAQQGWYRYHQLFADVLRYQLRAQDRALHDDLLVRAAHWHLERDQLRPAVEYLLRAERWQRALDLIGAHGWTFYERGDAALAIRWLEAVPSGERRLHGQADYTLVVLHRLVGNSATAAALLDELVRQRPPGSRGAMAVAVVRAMGINWDVGPRAAVAAAREGLAWFEGGAPVPGKPSEPPDSWICGWARIAGAQALVHLGAWGEARTWFDLALDEVVPHLPLRIRALGALAGLEAEEGHLDQASGHAQQALKLAVEVGDLDATSAADAHLAAGVVAYERDDLDQAARSLAEAEVQARVDKAANRLAGVVAEQARLALAQGRHRHGIELLARWRREGDPPPPGDVLARVAAAEAELLTAVGEPERARRTLARAEHSPDTLAAAARLAADAGDWATLSLVLARWPASTRRGRIQHALWRAVAADAAGDAGATRAGLAHAVRLAELEGHRRALLDAGPRVVELLRSSDVLESSPRWEDLRVVLATAAAPATDAPGGVLSPRELVVLGELATLMTNQEIAEKLAVSTNTLKTHVRRIYRKLGVTTRRGALARAVELGLH